MASVYLHDVNFHVPTEEECDEIRSMQLRNTAKTWLKRLLIFALLIGTFAVFQIIARHTVPHMFGSQKTVERLLRNCAYTFLGINILSYFQLWFDSHVNFDIETARVEKFVVTKKMVDMHYTLIPIKFRHVVCDKDGAFVLDRIWVQGSICFSNIKVGDTIYVERLHDEGHHQYYFVA